MIIAGEFSFKRGKEVVENRYPTLLKEIKKAIAGVDASKHLTKSSEEKTMPGKMLYNPVSLNKAFKNHLAPLGWKNSKVPCEYPTQYYTKDYKPLTTTRGAYREMDFVKSRLGVEIQFGKYAFMVYNVCAKMTIFHNLGLIDAGIEIVPIKQFAETMSTGVS